MWPCGRYGHWPRQRVPEDPSCPWLWAAVILPSSCSDRSKGDSSCLPVTAPSYPFHGPSFHPILPGTPSIPLSPAGSARRCALSLGTCTSSFSLYTCWARAHSVPPLLAATLPLIFLEPLHALFKFNLPLTQPSCAPRAGPAPQTVISPSTALP